jgi:1-aminocyclopropane-1-carboxylate deaminase
MLAPFSTVTIHTDTPGNVFGPGVDISVLRLDEVHPVISGNKWFKLRYYIDEAKTLGKKNIVTFGGAWSNHIVATAAACRMNELKSTGLIRGEEPAQLSPTLMQAKEYGMQLLFLSRAHYSDKQLPALFADDYLIAEGGYGPTGARGAASILDHISADYTHYCCAVGTGTMMAGLINASGPHQQVVGISVMKNNRQLDDRVRDLVLQGNESHSWQLLHDYHFGGYAKYEPSLLQFMNDFYRRTGIPSDFVYTGKLFYAVNDLVQRGYFPPGSRLLLIHSGGLQGNASLGKGTLMF